jgi:HEAT repeat protein
MVASASAIALGKLGGDAAAAALQEAVGSGAETVRDAAAHGCVLAAEHYLAAKKPEAAIKLYDLVRNADVPKQRKLEGTRGAILARGNGGVDLLVENLRSGDQAFINIALGTARELKAAQVTDALVAELPKAASDQQRLIILALADRDDPKALPAVVQAAKDGATSVRITAVGVLERLGNVSTIPVLLEAAGSEEPELARAARTTLSRLGGKEVDAELMQRMEQSSGNARRVLIELAEMRRMEGVLPAFLKYTADPDPAVRQAAVEAIGEIGQAAQAADLVKLLQKPQEARDRAALERSLTSLCSRYGAACAAHLLPLAQGDDPATRVIAVRALSSCGGPEALAAIRSALEDKDESVQDEAVRMLATWPNRWPADASVLEPLMAVAKAPRKPNHQVLAIRGYLQFLQGARKLSAGDRLSKAGEILPLITRPEEKRLAISVLSAIGTSGSVRPLVAFTSDRAVTEEAANAIFSILAKNPAGLSADQRRAALEAVADNASNEATRTKAREMLNK